jgi:hypothetical protein
MKKFFAILAIGAIVASCNSGESKMTAEDSARYNDSIAKVQADSLAAASAATADTAKVVADSAKAKVDSLKTTVDSLKK